MDDKTISVIEKQIGDTLYIIESVVSSTAKLPKRLLMKS